MRGRIEKPQVQGAAYAKKQIEMCWRAFCTKDARHTTINGEECHTTKVKPMTATTTITNFGEDRKLKGRKSCTGKGGQKDSVSKEIVSGTSK